uniref:Uncharacterized protein n=1 Tax=Steinernema glaseri TaxID=37863 RepID=A0A1I8ALY3_9BILA
MSGCKCLKVMQAWASIQVCISHVNRSMSFATLAFAVLCVAALSAKEDHQHVEKGFIQFHAETGEKLQAVMDRTEPIPANFLRNVTVVGDLFEIKFGNSCLTKDTKIHILYMSADSNTVCRQFTSSDLTKEHIITVMPSVGLRGKNMVETSRKGDGPLAVGLRGKNMVETARKGDGPLAVFERNGKEVVFGVGLTKVNRTSDCTVFLRDGYETGPYPISEFERWKQVKRVVREIVIDEKVDVDYLGSSLDAWQEFLFPMLLFLTFVLLTTTYITFSLAMYHRRGYFRDLDNEEDSKKSKKSAKPSMK